MLTIKITKSLFLCLHDVRQGMCSLLVLAWLGSAYHCSDHQCVHIIEIHPIFTILRVQLHIHLGTVDEGHNALLALLAHVCHPAPVSLLKVGWKHSHATLLCLHSLSSLLGLLLLCQLGSLPLPPCWSSSHLPVTCLSITNAIPASTCICAANLQVTILNVLIVISYLTHQEY